MHSTIVAAWRGSWTDRYSKRQRVAERSRVQRLERVWGLAAALVGAFPGVVLGAVLGTAIGVAVGLILTPFRYRIRRRCSEPFALLPLWATAL